MAPPRKYNQALAKRLGVKLRKGWSLTSASESEGLSKTTVFDWITDGQKPRAAPELAAFAETLKAARAAARGYAEARVMAGRSGKGGQWQGAARWLESMADGEWIRVEGRKVEHSGAVRLAFDDLPAAAKAPGRKGAAATADVHGEKEPA